MEAYGTNASPLLVSFGRDEIVSYLNVTVCGVYLIILCDNWRIYLTLNLKLMAFKCEP